MSWGAPCDTSSRHHRLASPLIVLLVLAAPFWTVKALAAARLSRIDIGAGPLQQALAQLADLTQLQILYDPALVQGRITRGVSGAKTPSEALQQLLASTGISFEFTADDAVALHPTAHSNSAASTYTGPPPPKL